MTCQGSARNWCVAPLPPLPLAVVFQFKTRLLLALWVCGRGARGCGQPVGRATTSFAACSGLAARSIGCPNVFSSGRSAARGLVHISTGFLLFGSGALGQDTVKQTATVDQSEMRGLVTDRTSLRRGAGLSLKTGFIDRERPCGIVPPVDAGIARTRILHTGPTMP